MARPSKYPWDKIELDYVSGLSPSDLHKKYEVPYNRLSERTKKWEQSEQAKSIVMGFDRVSEQVSELKTEQPEVAKNVLDIVKDRHPQFKQAMVALSGKLFKKMMELTDEANANDVNQIAKGMQTIADTLGVSQRFATKPDINISNQNQQNTAISNKIEIVLDE